MEYNFDVNSDAKKFEPYYLKCICAGRAHEGLRANWQKQLRTVQNEIGFEYIRFHGIFNDEMAIYSEDENGNPKFFWQYFDELFDFLKEVKLKPIFELSFMPEAISTKPHTLFWWKGNACPTTDYDKWAQLVKATVIHCVERYGIDDVLEWKWEVWNEPNLGSFWTGTQEEYFRLYQVTVKAIKSVDKRFAVGGPSSSGADFRDNLNYLKAFIDFCSAEKLPLDFVSAHPYPTYCPLDTFGNEQMGYMSKNCNIEHLDLIRDIIDHSPYPNAEIHLTEYNTSPSPRDLIHDTLFPAPFLLYNLTQNIGKVDSLGFWTFTDIFEENGPGESQFHGGFGLMNVLGIRKPSYFAYKFLADMGSNLVYRDENCFATKKDEKMHILLWNYCYYSDAFASGDRSALSLYSRDDVFENKEFSFTVHIENAKAIKAYKLGRDNGSALHNWLRMGAPESPTQEQTFELISKSVPSEIKFMNHCKLNSNEVVYIIAE